MPILKLIGGSPELSLAPEDIEALIEAYDYVLLALKIDRAGPDAERVAKQVIAVAQLGESPADGRWCVCWTQLGPNLRDFSLLSSGTICDSGRAAVKKC